MEAQRRRLSVKSALGKALQYALSRWDALTRYVEDGRLSIDNNLAERQLRGVAVTRKNFLFLGSDTGGQRAAAIYTVAETAKLNGLDPTSPPSSTASREDTRPAGSTNCCPGTSRNTVKPRSSADAYVPLGINRTTAFAVFNRAGVLDA